MAAEILEQLEDTTPTDAIPVDDTVMTQEDLVTDLAPADTVAPIQDPEDDIPEKYRGKSIKEVIGMHQSAESLIGSQGSEVGELRKVVDAYINTQLQPPTPEQPEPDPVDFFEDPEKAVSQAIAQHPDMVNARQQAQEMKRSSSLSQLQTKHPDMQDVLTAPAFAEWIKGSPIRMELYNRADQGFEFNAADELVSTFKERAQVAQQAIQTETAARQQAIKSASTGSATGTGNAGTKRVYRRADIIKLMKTDPDRYEALNPEIMLAYQEGRVR
jgi:hypothetical protein